MNLKLIATALLALSALSLAFGETCPPNAPDCFMCGAPPTGVPCNRNCTAHSVPGLGYVACELPQGEQPICYCPYGTSISDIASQAPDCKASAFPDCNGCGYLESYEGTVMVKSHYAGGWCVVKGRLRLPQGTQVWTTSDSAVRITYPRVIMDVGPDSELTIRRASLQSKHSFLSVETAKAVFRMAFNELSEDEWFDMQVDQVFSGCFGTEFIVEADGSNVAIKVLDGSVWMKGAGADKNITLSAGEYAVAPKAGGAPSNPAQFNPASIDEWWNGEPPSGGCCGSAFILLLAPLLGAFLARR